MNLFLNIVTAGCFLFGVFAGANTQSLREYSLKENKLKVVEAKLTTKELINLSLQDLSEIKI